MPVTRSAKKAFRQNIRRRAKNVEKRGALKGAIKAYKKSPSPETLSQVFQTLDKSAKINLIRKNTASRLKSRLSKLLKVK